MEGARHGLWRTLYVSLFCVLAAQLVSLSMQAKRNEAVSEQLIIRAMRTSAMTDSIAAGVELARAAATQAVKNQTEIRNGVSAILKRVDRLDRMNRVGRRNLVRKIAHVQSTADSVQDALPPSKKGKR